MNPEDNVKSLVSPLLAGREPDGVDLELFNAVARRDAASVEAAVADGADVNFLDIRGMTPLHHAVAHRGLDMVEILLRLGADPLVNSDLGNSVCFASLDDNGEIAPCAASIENDRHGGIIVALVEAGADVDARQPTGETLTDLAIATVPYPDQIIEYLRHRGGSPGKRAGSSLPDHLRQLAPGDWREQAVRVNEVRYLLEHDPEPQVTDALHWLLQPEWTEDEVSAETLFELTDLLLDYGAQNTTVDGSNPMDRAFELFGNGQRPQYQVVTYRLRKAGFTRSLPGMLEWLPEGDPATQRAYLAELREQLEAQAPQPRSLHWLLSPHGWYEHEVGGEILGELTDLLLEHGGRNTPVNGRTPLGWARFWLDRGEHSQYRVVVDRLLAAGFTYSVRDFLDRIPKGDKDDQREFLVELRERMDVDGPQPDALHWLLSPNSKWTEAEVSGEILGELTELLLEYGARDDERDEARPLDRALNRVVHDELGNYQSVVDRLRAAGFKSATLTRTDTPEGPSPHAGGAVTALGPTPKRPRHGGRDRPGRGGDPVSHRDFLSFGRRRARLRGFGARRRAALGGHADHALSWAAPQRREPPGNRHVISSDTRTARHQSGHRDAVDSARGGITSPGWSVGVGRSTRIVPRPRSVATRARAARNSSKEVTGRMGAPSRW